MEINQHGDIWINPKLHENADSALSIKKEKSMNDY